MLRLLCKCYHKDNTFHHAKIENQHVDILVQDCSISIANALEILQSCTKPSMYMMYNMLKNDVENKLFLIHGAPFSMKWKNPSISRNSIACWASQTKVRHNPGVVSLTFHERSKIFSRNLFIAEIILLFRISSARTKFQLAILTRNVISGISFFARLFWRARETLVKQLPGART